MWVSWEPGEVSCIVGCSVHFILQYNAYLGHIKVSVIEVSLLLN